MFCVLQCLSFLAFKLLKEKKKKKGRGKEGNTVQVKYRRPFDDLYKSHNYTEDNYLLEFSHSMVEFISTSIKVTKKVYSFTKKIKIQICFITWSKKKLSATMVCSYLLISRTCLPPPLPPTTKEDGYLNACALTAQSWGWEGKMEEVGQLPIAFHGLDW